MDEEYEHGEDYIRELAYLIDPDGTEIGGTWDEMPDGRASTLRLIAGNIEERATTGSVWHSFVEIRNRLEPLGYRCRCHGARADVMSSQMSIQMGGGVMA